MRLREFQADYRAALVSYLSGGAEKALSRAYELGRGGVARGLGVLDMVDIHKEAVTALLAAKQGDLSTNLIATVNATEEFLREALSAFEVMQIGFKDATDSVQRSVRFAALVCHELRAPLTSIMASAGMLEAVLAIEDPNRAEKRLLANILDGAAKLKARTSELTDIVGFQTGELRLHTEAADVRPVVKTVCRRFEPEIIQRGLELRVDIPPKLPVVNGDCERLEQVLSNLIDNAMKYGADGRVIDVRAAVMKDELRLQVQDYGKGIPLPDQSKLFQVSFRGESDRHRISGLGIGLALCNAIIEAHGGRIWVESEEHKGSTFNVALPILRRHLNGRAGQP